MSHPDSPVSRRVLDQAIDWQVRMSSGESTERDAIALEFWLSAHPDHARAWQQLVRLDASLAPAESQPVRHVLTQLLKARKAKRIAGSLGAVLAIASAAALYGQYQPWSGWFADYHTATGERQLVVLPDNTMIRLNTRTAIDIEEDAQQRTIILRDGEIEVETGHGTIENLSLMVATESGSLRPLGTRFVVRKLSEGTTLLSVTQAAVAVRPASCSIRANEACSAEVVVREAQSIVLHPEVFSQPLASPPFIDAWKDGMLVVENTTLEDVVAELARYRVGIIRVHPDVAALRITGTFPIDDIDYSIAAITQTLPVRVTNIAGLWRNLTHLKDIGFAQKREQNVNEK
ncbi:FecR domain-containing protein [Methylobacillus methanolivorans]|uniref:FecR domain-containing protein n=1 Tax=Methylobacillus methanolivorans TaxID=1848927 RepID=A0ABW8GP70_9PROT